MAAQPTRTVAAPMEFLVLVAKTYSADNIACGKGLRGTFGYEGRPRVCVAVATNKQGISYADAYEIVSRGRYTKKTHLYGEERIHTYHGMVVTWEKKEYVLTNRITFELDSKAPMPDMALPPRGIKRAGSQGLDFFSGGIEPRRRSWRQIKKRKQNEQG